ncbi:hypothetical protein GGF50DRAFT_59288 [Schizophyllum commune]
MLNVPELRLSVFRYLWASELYALRLSVSRYGPEDKPTFHKSPTTFRITRPLTTEDWLPVVGRARCLKDFRFSSYSNACTNETLEAIIACPPPRVPLFPGVRTAQLDRPYRAGQDSFVYHRLLSILFPPRGISKLNCAGYEDDIPDAHAFLSHFPSLESLEMVLGAGEYAHRHSQFINTWPYFVFDPSHDPAKRYDIQFIGALRICPRLRDIDIKFEPWITAHILEVLAQLPSLQTLRLRFGNHANPSESVESSLDSPSYSFPAFPALRSLTIDGLAPSAVARLLSTSTPTPLHDIRIECPYGHGYLDPLHMTKAQMTALIELVTSQLVPYSSLRTLHLVGYGYQRYTLTLEELLPLSRFPELRDLSIGIRSTTFSLTDGDCERTAGWWPYIKTLLLGPEICGYRDTGKVSLQALLHLAARCPDLTHIRLPLDASIVPEFQPTPGPYPRLYMLHVGDAPIDNAARVGEFLKATFPKARDLWYDSDHYDDEVDRREAAWDVVYEMLTGKKRDYGPDFSHIHEKKLTAADSKQDGNAPERW